MINVVYTNDKCSDVYNIFKSQHQKFSDLELFTISNYEGGDYVYQNNDPYYSHWVGGLEKIQDDYFIYNQEDFILYDKVNTQKLKELQNFLENTNYSFVRLIRSGQNLSNIQVGENLYETGRMSYPLFSMQATLWKKDKFIELYNHTKQDLWFENDVYENACRELEIYGVYYYAGEKPRGGHFDSSVYPYIATAVVKGQWNYSEYEKELQLIFMEYGINPFIRGLR